MRKEEENTSHPPSLEEELKYTQWVLSQAVMQLNGAKTILDDASRALGVSSDVNLQLVERLKHHSNAIFNFNANLK